MVVANNEIDATKNAGNLTTISMTMRMRQCLAPWEAHPPMKLIQGFTQSHWMLPLGKFLHRITAVAAMVDGFGRKHKTLTTNYFKLANLQ
jgi:hypothetical protein